VTIDLEFDDAQQSIASAVSQFCRERCDADRVKRESGQFPRGLWDELAQLGMLAIGTPEGEGGALEMIAAMEVLGAHVFPGPLVATFLANKVLEETERLAVVEGRSIVCAGSAPLVPWAGAADLFLEIDGERVFKARADGPVEEVETLGGEPWGRLQLIREAELPGGLLGIVFADIALAAYQTGAGTALVEAASHHASTRTQFGRAIGEFQAVAHPLADCSMDLAAAQGLVRRAGFLYDEVDDLNEKGESDASRLTSIREMACGAKLSANGAALRAANVCHQVFGANGITLEGPVFHVTRRIRQLASQSRSDRAEREVLLGAIGMGNGAGATA
jgi:alkylation response protein AidB-like acyl-CoA dehydrogenase